MKIDIIIFIIWAFVGVINLFVVEGNSRFGYFCCWVALMFQLLGNVVQHL